MKNRDILIKEILELENVIKKHSLTGYNLVFEDYLKRIKVMRVSVQNDRLNKPDKTVANNLSLLAVNKLENQNLPIAEKIYKVCNDFERYFDIMDDDFKSL
jgi:hypothetical protein